MHLLNKRLDKILARKTQLCSGISDMTLTEWERYAKINDKGVMDHWDKALDLYENYKTNIKDVVVDFDRMQMASLHDRHRYRFWRPLKVMNKQRCENEWKGQKAGREYIFLKDEEYSSSFRCEQTGKIVGFDFLNAAPELEEPGTVMCADQVDNYGTFESFYVDIFPALMLQPLLDEYGSQHIDLTVIGSGFKSLDKPVIIPRRRRDERDPIVIEEESDEEISNNEDSGHVEPEEEMQDDKQQSEDTPEEQEPKKEDTPSVPEPVIHINKSGKYTPERVDPVEDEVLEEFNKYIADSGIQALQDEALEDKAERIRKTRLLRERRDTIPAESRSSYISEDNIDSFFSHVMASSAFKSAAEKKNFKIGTKVCRVCVMCLAKSHILKVVWDRLLNDSMDVIQNRVYVCQNAPSNEYWYPEEFDDGDINASFVRSFLGALKIAGYVTMDNTQIFLDTAYRAVFRKLLFYDHLEEGEDLSCNAFQMLSTLYLSMTENAVLDLEAVRQFSSLLTKRFLRFYLKCFQLNLRSLAHSKIVKSKEMLWLPPIMQESFVNYSDICIMSVNKRGRQEIFHYKGDRKGFVTSKKITPRSIR